MTKTKIEWATDVWNPTVGCTKVSSGCKNCYAERMFNRFHPDEKFSDVRCYPERLNQPLHWKKPRRIFVDSMSDLFHKNVPDDFIREVFLRMQMSVHTFMILTKRPIRMFKWLIRDKNPPILPNVWLGVSVENQATADYRIPLLLQIPAALRFVSVEPMLGPIVESLSRWYSNDSFDPNGSQKVINRAHWPFPKIDWVICGCESGPYKRPMDLDWARSLRDQCQMAGVPFFLKQAVINGKLVKMPELDGKVWDEIPT